MHDHSSLIVKVWECEITDCAGSFSKFKNGVNFHWQVVSPLISFKRKLLGGPWDASHITKYGEKKVWLKLYKANYSMCWVWTACRITVSLPLFSLTTERISENVYTALIYLIKKDSRVFLLFSFWWCWKASQLPGGGDSSVVRVQDLWLKGCRFESLQEQWENFLLQGRLSVLTLISVSVPPLCYHSSTYKILVMLPKMQVAGYS